MSVTKKRREFAHCQIPGCQTPTTEPVFLIRDREIGNVLACENHFRIVEVPEFVLTMTARELITRAIDDSEGVLGLSEKLR